LRRPIIEEVKVMTDFVSWLSKLYFEQHELGEGQKETIGEFIKFSHARLKENPPVSVIMADNGIGVRFADTTEVSVLPSAEEEEATPDYMPITRPKSLPMQHGVTDTRCIPIFGGK
jgi:hypothetical protein